MDLRDIDADSNLTNSDSQMDYSEHVVLHQQQLSAYAIKILKYLLKLKMTTIHANQKTYLIKMILKIVNSSMNQHTNVLHALREVQKLLTRQLKKLNVSLQWELKHIVLNLTIPMLDSQPVYNVKKDSSFLMININLDIQATCLNSANHANSLDAIQQLAVNTSQVIMISAPLYLNAIASQELIHSLEIRDNVELAETILLKTSMPTWNAIAPKVLRSKMVNAMTITATKPMILRKLIIHSVSNMEVALAMMLFVEH
jgi:hypothetical protein